MKKFIEKYKTEILMVLILFTIYFFVGSILTYYLQTYKFVNVLFDLDTPRVFMDLTSKAANHYRTSVHPLFVICFQPIIFVLKHIVRHPEIAVIIVQSLMGSLNALFIYLICKKLGLDKSKSIVVAAVFACTFSQIVFAASIETYMFAQFFLILLWLFTVYNLDKKMNVWKYIILAILGVMSIAVTLTNFMQFIIAASLLTLFNKKDDTKFINRLTKYGCLLFCVVSISIFAADAQLIVWHSTPNYFVKNVQDFRSSNSEESLYMSKPNMYSFGKQFDVMFSNNFNISNLKWTYNSYLTFNDSLLSKIIAVILAICFGVLNVYYIVKEKINFNKNKYYYALLLAFLGNFCLHLVYGNNIAFMYIAHYNFLLILCIVWILHNLKIKKLNNSKLNIAIILVAIGLVLKNIIQMFMILIPRYNPVDHISYIPIIILVISLLLIALIIFKKKYIKLISILVAIFLVFGLHHVLNIKKVETNKDKDLFMEYNINLNNYTSQLKEMKNTYNVRNFIKPEKPIDIFYFGMADRQKILYKDGKLIDIKTKEIIKEVDYKEELIVPNEYSVLLKDKDDNVYLIEENEDGIFFSKNNEKEQLVESGKEIHLPEFEDKKYGEVMKVLHQEVLFNIDGSEPIPNIIGYKQPFYRDAMLATLVLEETGNVHLLTDWVNSLDSIYDYARSSEIKETDNLGELLYMIGATGADRQDLIDEILEEIDSIKTEDNMISGYIDSFDQKYYPTAIAIFGEEKLGITPNLTLNNIDDGYGKLTWYYDNPNMVWAGFMDSPLFPYLGWAQLHDTTFGNVYILDEIYPLSYEAGEPRPGYKSEPYCFISEFYCVNATHISHLWDASEKFLFLRDAVN